VYLLSFYLSFLGVGRIYLFARNDSTSLCNPICSWTGYINGRIDNRIMSSSNQYLFVYLSCCPIISLSSFILIYLYLSPYICVSITITKYLYTCIDIYRLIFWCIVGLMWLFKADEYILATINLYLDVINLFIYILMLIGLTKSD